jgi:Flp pilus assembly protein TadB
MQRPAPQPQTVISDTVAAAMAAPFAVAAAVEHGWVGLVLGTGVIVLVTVVSEVSWWLVLGRRQRHQTRLLDRGLTVDDVLRLTADVDAAGRAEPAEPRPG